MMLQPFDAKKFPERLTVSDGTTNVLLSLAAVSPSLGVSG